MSHPTTTLLAGGFAFLEGPRWHRDELWVSDMFDHKVYRVAADGAARVVAAIPGRPSGIGFLPDGTPLVVSMTDRQLQRITAGGPVTHARLAPWSATEINDMVVDDTGRAYVGNFGFDLFGGEQAEPGVLFMVEPDGRVRVAAESLDIPNGAVITNGGRTLVVAETRGGVLTAFDRAADGTLSRRRVHALLAGRTPDGICLDTAGAIWVASFHSGEFVRVLEGGAIADRIDVTPRRAVACQLGGSDGRTLFCLTLEGPLSDAARGRRGARIETVRVAVPGAGSP